MKRIVILLSVLILSTLTLGPVSATIYDEQLVVVNEMATYLVNNQNDDGGWDWIQPADGKGDPDSTTGSTVNTAGATARGLIAAYAETGNINYLNTAVKTGEYIVDNITTVVGAHKDSLFLNELDQAMQAAGLDNSYAGQTFAGHAGDSVDAAVAVFESGTYTNSRGTVYTWVASGDLEYDILNAFITFRGDGTDEYAGLTLWETGEWAQALYEIDYTSYGANALNLADLLFDETIGADGIFGTTDDGFVGPDTYEDWWWGLGLSGLLEGMATAGSDQGDIDKVVAELSSMGTYDDYQNAGYYALAMELAGEESLAIAAGLDIYNAFIADGVNNGYGSVYVESLGEALHGLSNNPVPEPTTMVLFSLGILGLAGVSRRKQG